MCLCLSSKKPSKREFFVPAGTGDLGGLLLPFLFDFFYKRDDNLTHLFYLKGAAGSVPIVWYSPLHSRYVLIRPFFDEKEVTTCCNGLGVILLNY